MNKGDRLNYWHPGHADVYEKQKGNQTFSMVPVDCIREFLDNVPVSYAYHIVQSGITANGLTYLGITLRVEFDDGVLTVPGGADSANIGYAGLIGEALRNAVLRGLSMGKSLYEHETVAEVATTYENADHTQPYQPAAPTYTNTHPGNGQRPPWDGSVKFKQGKYAGQSYSEVPDDYIEFLASKGTETASLELARRNNGRSAQQTVNAGGRNFPASPFSR